MSISSNNIPEGSPAVNTYRVGLISAVLTLSGFFCMLSETVLNMALKNLLAQFNITAITVQWLSTGYMLVMAVSIPISAF